MASVRYTIRALAFEGNSPDAVLEKCGRQLDLGDQFATVVVGVVDMAQRELTLANAGHPNPLILVGDSAEFLTSEPGLPIGISKGSTYRPLTIEIPPQAMLIAYTDGLVERRGECIDVGMQRLRDSAIANQGDIEQIVSKVLTELTSNGPADDVAILGVQWEH
jgi:serine phosphatase RsbU (regulator of sigma subunit)